MFPRPSHSRVALAIAIAAMLPLAACSDYGLGGGPGYASDRHDDGYYIGDNDPIYRDRDGRYYCKKPDGSTGLIVGGLAGGVLGNIIAPGGSKTLGTILGAAGGALVGWAIDRSKIHGK